MAGRRYNPSVTAFKSLTAVTAPLTQGRRDSHRIAAAVPIATAGILCYIYGIIIKTKGGKFND